MNGDSMVTLMLQFDDYGGLICPTTIKLVYTSSIFRIKNQGMKIETVIIIFTCKHDY